MMRLCAVFALLALPAYALGQRDLKDIPDPDPELERRALQLADGFEINLFAADPLLAKPIQMNFDAAGRLWVVCSELYPQIKPGQKANDRIIILEDTDGDGRADKTTVFADGLLIPTGVEPGDGGAYVADSTDLVHIAADRATGKGGRRRIVLSGFGTEDTHHILHTLRWGPEGLLYFNQSIYIHSHIETPYGVRRLNAGGVWQFRPETMQLEVFARGWWNPWGHAFDRWGQSFVTDGAGTEGVNYVIPGGAYAQAAGATRIFPGLNPGSPKYCGEEITSGRHLPEEWRGNLLTNDFRGHRVCRFLLPEDGAGFAAVQQADLIRTNHAAFRPVDIKMGPDGAIYIADWYNPIIQHGEVDFRDPRRDHVHGRIWRVTYKGRQLVKRPQLVNASTETLLDALKAPEDWTRHFAKRVLKERGRSVLPTVAVWVQNLDRADPDYEHNLLEALWVYQALDTVEPNLLLTLLQAHEPHARAAATRVVSHWHARVPHALELLSTRVTDDHPRVRLEAVRALAHLSDPHAVETALHALDRPMDRFLDYALWLTVHELAPVWEPALEQGKLTLTNRPQHLLFALQAAGSGAAVRPLVELLRSGKVAPEHEGEVLVLLASVGGPLELDLVFDRALDPKRTNWRLPLLAALADAARQRKIKPGRSKLDRLAPLLEAGPDTVRASAARLAGLWREETLWPQLAGLALGAKTHAEVRRAAVEGLVALGGPTNQKLLVGLTGADRPAAVRRLALAALTRLDLRAAAARAGDVLAATPPGEDPSEVFLAFVERSGGAEALTGALVGKKLPADVAKVGLRTARSSGRSFPALTDALTKAGGLHTRPQALTAKELQALVADVQKYGDPPRGELVYRRADITCTKCHAISGAGGQVGPDLASIGASAQVDYLIESILVPNKAVKENYHTLVITTTDDRLFTGIKVRESKTELVLRDAEDHEVAIAVKDIAERGEGRSLMPDGLADSLTRGELLDLVRFLSELGKVGPYAVGKAKLVRRWQALQPTAPAKALVRQNVVGAVTGDPSLTWSSAYSLVSGVVPLSDIPRLDTDRGPATLGVAHCQMDVSTGGQIGLRLNSATGLAFWLDGVPVEVKNRLVLDVKPGIRTLTFAVDLTKRRDGLRCELEEVSGSPARVNVVGGK